METKHCPTCHAPIPDTAPGGFCPACLLRDAEEPPVYGRSAPPLEAIAAAFPHLEVIELIGQGGMGFVYKVRQPSLDRVVALKILSPELGRDPAFAERFSREARTLGKLHHPSIVTVFEHGEMSGFFYLTMEYVDGVNLRQAMRAGRFTPEQALSIVPGICDALQIAHEQGIWHRDIKPENILLDRDGKVKIADFGIARIVGDPQRDFTLTRTGNALGSAAYMAPEQHEKPHEVDHRADIYSLGVVIYEMLTGELPLGRFPAPSQRAAVDARIDEIVLKTLEKERELRQQSATEVKTDVQEATQPQRTGDVPRSKKQADTPTGVELSGNFPNFRLSLGLWIGGLAGVLAGMFTSPLVSGLGLVAAALGLIGCGWILWKIRHGDHPKEHRLPLLVFGFWPVVVGFCCCAIALWFIVWKRGEAQGVADPSLVLYGFAAIAIAAPLIIGRLLWNLFGKESVETPPNRFEKIQAIAAVLLILGTTVVVKWVNEREIAYNSYRSIFIQLHSEINWPEDESLVRQAVATALAEHSTNYHYHILAPGDPMLTTITRERGSPYVILETTIQSASNAKVAQDHFDAIGQRLKASLPNRIGVNTGAGGVWRPYQRDAPLVIQRGYRNVHFWNLVILITPILVVLLSVASRRPVPWILAILAVCMAAGVVISPKFQRPSGLPPSMDGMAPLPPLPMPEYDYSTTRDAVNSIIKAAKKGDVEAFKRGISGDLLEMTLAETSGFSEPMRDIAGMNYGGQISQEGNTASVNMVNQATKVKIVMPLVREDGVWKLAAPERNVAAEGSAGNWKATLTDQGNGLPKIVELPGSPETKLLFGMKASGWMVHIGAVPVLLIAGEGTSPGYGGSIGGGKLDGEIKFMTTVLKVSMEGGDAVSVNGTEFDLTKGRVLLVHRDGRVKQTDKQLLHILDDPELDNFVGQLLLDDGYNYWTPELALASHIKAATQKDLAVFECGVSTELITQISKGGVDVTGAMQKWSGLSVRNVIRKNQSGAGVRLVDEKTKDEFYAELIFFNDAWFINSLEPVPITAADLNAPERAMKELLHAAVRRDKEAMRASFSRSLLELIDANDSLDKTIEQLAASRLIGHRLIDPSNAEVTLESDDNPLKATFTMILEDGSWKLTEHVSSHD